MVPTDLNIGFQGLALIQGQIYNPGAQMAQFRKEMVMKHEHPIEFGPEIWSSHQLIYEYNIYIYVCTGLN